METEKKLLDEFSAEVWADEWLRVIKLNPNIPTDKGTMIGWFANAIMTGYDYARRENGTNTTT